MREFFYLLIKFCDLRFRFAKVVFENRVLRFRRRFLGIQLGYLLAEQRIDWQTLQNLVNEAHEKRFISLLSVLHKVNAVPQTVNENFKLYHYRRISTGPA